MVMSLLGEGQKEAAEIVVTGIIVLTCAPLLL
jgi:hypothetical protein